MVELIGHESVSGETMRRRLAENGLKPSPSLGAPSASSVKSPHGKNNETTLAPASKWMVHNRKSPRQNGPRLSRHAQRVIITVPEY
jgi:hypothetical protein